MNISEVFGMDSLDSIAPETIMTLWNTIHDKDPLTVSKVLSSFEYSVIAPRLKASPNFIFPIITLRFKITLVSENIENNYFKFSDIEDQHANSIMVLRMFDEISESKKIVPARGDIFGTVLSKKEADQILRSFFDYYLDSELYYKYVEVFNNEFEQFNYEEFILSYYNNY
jgi:hypothetical protein